MSAKVYASDSSNSTSCTILLKQSMHIITIVYPSSSGNFDMKSMWITTMASLVLVVEHIVQLPCKYQICNIGMHCRSCNTYGCHGSYVASKATL